jgi:PAS domain S-box-containing protein
MPIPLRLLLVEDDATDAALALHNLDQHGFAVTSTRVDTAPALTAALAEGGWDAVLASDALSGFSAPQALRLLRASGQDLPFIFLSGVMDEAAAAASLSAGAHDVVPTANLARLGPALERELRAAQDRRARAAAEAAQRQQAAGFQLLFHDNPLPMWVYDPDSLRFLEVNQAAIDHYGYTRAEWLELTLADIRPPEDLDRLMENVRRARGRPDRSGPWRHLKQNGDVIDVDIVASDTEFGGRPARLVLALDITERRRAEGALIESEARLRQVWENTTDALALSDADGTVLAANPAYCELYGRPAEQVVGHNFALIFPEETREWARAGYHQVFTGPDAPAPYETAVRRADGTTRIVEARASFLTSGGQRTAMLSTIRDITARTQAEAQIQRQVSFLSALREIDRAISGSMDPRLSLSLLLTHTTDELGVDAAAVWTFRPEMQILERLVERGLRPRPPHLATQRLGEGPVGRAAHERRRVFLEDLRASGEQSRLVEAALAEGFVNLHALPLIAKGEVRGVLEVYQRLPKAGAPPRPPDNEWHDFLTALAGEAAIALDNALLFNGLQRANVGLSAAFDSLLDSFARALDQRHGEPEGHSRRVADLTDALGRAQGLDGADLNHARRGGLLHDVGKLRVPERILLKPEPLTGQEWQALRQAPAQARDLLATVALLRPAAEALYGLHEHWDGSGYPLGLAGERIPLLARLGAVASAWEALRTDRPYRPALSPAQARVHLNAAAGKQFDPKVVKALMELRVPGA